MNNEQVFSRQLHTADYFQKARAVRSRSTRSRPHWAWFLGVAVLIGLALAAPRSVRAAQQYRFEVTVDSGSAARVDMPVEAPLDLTTFLAGVTSALDPGAFQVVEVDTAGAVLNDAVLFQFDAAPGFDATSYAAGDIVFVMNDTTPAQNTRRFRILFDVVSACGDCPPAPAAPTPVSVDSLIYENQMTYLVSTPRADYYYHRAGGGLASIVDNDGQDWIGFHDISGSKTAGEYRGIPNLVFKAGDDNASFFHPGFDNATTTLVNAGPLKVTVRSVTNDPANQWILQWEFYQAFARLTVQQVGTSNDGAYWFLYEGTPGGALDPGDVVVRSDGTTASAMDNADQWEATLADPQWLYFHDTAGSRYLYLSDDSGDVDPDSYRSQGQTSTSTPEMTVFGYGRVMNTSANSLVPRMSGAGRTFTLGLGEDTTDAGAEIEGSRTRLTVTVGKPTGSVSAVGDITARWPILNQNYPNPFNPATTISFVLPEPGSAQLAVYDTAGRLVDTLVNRELTAGPHAFRWAGRNRSGRPAASGIYLYRLITADAVLRGKMTLVE